MSDTNRRRFLAVAGAGAAAGTVALTTGRADAADSASDVGAAQEAVVAYIEDHRSSELRLMVGHREVVVHDRALVKRILKAAGGK